jgi:hypothetical protein
MNSWGPAVYVPRSSRANYPTQKRRSSLRCQDRLRANTQLLVLRDNVVIGVSTSLKQFINQIFPFIVCPVSLEHLYHQRGLLVKRYPRRGEIYWWFWGRLPIDV